MDQPLDRRATLRRFALPAVVCSAILFASYVRADPSGWPPDVIRYSLGGLSLACWCPLPAEGEPDICHARVLMELANGGNCA